MKLFPNPQISPSGPPKLIESLPNIHSTTKEIPGDGPLIDTNVNRKYLVLTNKTNIIHHKSVEENQSSITYKNPATQKKKFNNQYYNPFKPNLPDCHIMEASSQSIYQTVEPKLKKCSNWKLPFIRTHHTLLGLCIQDVKDVAIIIRKLMKINDVLSLKKEALFYNKI